MHRILTTALLLTLSSLFYYGGFSLNTFLFSRADFSVGVNWIFLPAGLRLLLTLLFAEEGAVGIAISSMAIGLFNFFTNDPLTAITSGIISGVSPYIARMIILHKTNLSEGLGNLSTSLLMQCAFIFSIISPTLHQIWFYIQGYTSNFWSSLCVMMIGDLIGSIIVIYLAKLSIDIWRIFSPR